MTIEILHIDCMGSKKGFQKGHKFQSWKGKKHKPETILKMRAARLKNQPMHNPEIVAKRSATLKSNGTFAKGNSNNWKGGITKESILARNSEETQKWRNSVFNRDNFTCQACGARCGNGVDVVLHSHHIKRFSDFPELRFDVSNGQTLCATCHRLEHNNNA